MAGRTCFHCKDWVEDGEAHDCWTTTEAALTRDLSDDLRDAWERLRETVAGFGEQRIYASHHSIMFSRRSCYLFVRPKRSFLELNLFLGRTIRSARVKRVIEGSASRRVHVIHVRHRDEVESGSSTRAFITSAKGFLSASCSARPASAKPEFEYENARPGGSRQYSPV